MIMIVYLVLFTQSVKIGESQGDHYPVKNVLDENCQSFMRTVFDDEHTETNIAD